MISHPKTTAAASGRLGQPYVATILGLAGCWSPASGRQ
jgi:hypothetical protein